MDVELAHLRGQLDQAAESTPAVLVVSGMGMVSAAAATQDTISRHAPRAVLNYGCAGAHRASLMPGDLVIGQHVVAYDSYRETPDGRLEYRGMHYRLRDEQRRLERLPCDAGLVAAARRVAEAIGDGHEPWPANLGWPTSVAHRAPRVVYGTVASADRWNRSPSTIAALAERHDSLCEDMEAAAMGLVCASHEVPFLTIKDISNNELLRATASGTAVLDELGTDQIARRAAMFTLSLLRELTVLFT
jgi:adenosylhomocysteine nucleosidase